LLDEGEGSPEPTRKELKKGLPSDDWTSKCVLGWECECGGSGQDPGEKGQCTLGCAFGTRMLLILLGIPTDKTCPLGMRLEAASC
jgi:hypothetical protein